jgi:hypothetical protein
MKEIEIHKFVKENNIRSYQNSDLIFKIEPIKIKYSKAKEGKAIAIFEFKNKFYLIKELVKKRYSNRLVSINDGGGFVDAVEGVKNIALFFDEYFSYKLFLLKKGEMKKAIFYEKLSD